MVAVPELAHTAAAPVLAPSVAGVVVLIRYAPQHLVLLSPWAMFTAAHGVGRGCGSTYEEIACRNK